MDRINGRIRIKGEVTQIQHDQVIKPSKDVLYTFTLIETPAKVFIPSSYTENKHSHALQFLSQQEHRALASKLHGARLERMRALYRCSSVSNIQNRIFFFALVCYILALVDSVV